MWFTQALCLGVWVLAAYPSHVFGAERLALRLDDAASLKPWSFSEGPEFPGAAGRIEWLADQGHDQPGCLGLGFDFSGGGSYVQASVPLPRENDFGGARLWINKAGPHRITIRCTDRKGQSFQKGVDYHYEGWQAVEVRFEAWHAHWGGPNDGRVSWPLVHFGILVENSAEPKAGLLLVDDVEFLPGPAHQASADREVSTYLASDFHGSPGWGASASKLVDGVWSYSASADQRPQLGTSFSFLGRPKTMRLVIDTNVAGPELSVNLLSHFQTFYCTVGRLEGRGKQVLEVPLGDMAGWEHAGGEDDGQLRLPLRMQYLRLNVKDGPAEGRIRLLRLEIDTQLDQGQTTLIVPDARVEGGQAKFRARLSSLVRRAQTGRLLCEVRSLARRLHVETFELTLPSLEENGGRIEKEFAFPVGEHHMLEANWAWQSAEGVGAGVSIGVATVPDEPYSTQTDPASPVGMGLYLYRHRGASSERLNQLCELAAKAGVRHAREEFVWNWIEPSKGRFDWSFYDQVVDAQRRHGIRTYALLTYWSDWTKRCTAEGIADYCAYVRQVVRHFKDRIHCWEVWNEPNIFFWSCDRELYPQLLAQAYDAIKAEDPDAHVLGCSTSGIDIPFIKMTMEHGGKFDVLSVHPYRERLNDTAYLSDLAAASKLVDGRPLWLTEIGFPSQLLKGWSERSQASLVARIYLLSIASGVVGTVSWYDFRNDGSDPFESEQNFGVVREDLRPKPAYRTLATLGRTLAGLRPAGQIEMDQGTYAFRFSGADRDVIAVCAPDAGRLLSCRTEGKVRILNAVGEALSAAGHEGRMTVTLDGGFPLYLEGPPGFTWTPLPERYRLVLDRRTAHPGDSIQLKLEPPVPAEAWELPVGWSEPTARGDGGYTLTVPSGAGRGPMNLWMCIKDGTPLWVPATIHVQPQVVRF